MYSTVLYHCIYRCVHQYSTVLYRVGGYDSTTLLERETRDRQQRDEKILRFITCVRVPHAQDLIYEALNDWRRS